PIAFRLTSWMPYPTWSVFTHHLRKLITAVEGHYPASTAKPELVDEVAEKATVHPIDTHPLTRIRVEPLGISVPSLRDNALHIDSSFSSALLLDNVTELEEYLTDIEHRILLELGYAQLPEAQAQP